LVNTGLKNKNNLNGQPKFIKAMLPCCAIVPCTSVVAAESLNDVAEKKKRKRKKT